MNELFYNMFDLDSEMDLKLLEMEVENIDSGGIKKRMKRELKAFKDTCSSISLNYIGNTYNNMYKVYNKPSLKITVMDKVCKKNNVYSFIIDENYPFHPPKVEIHFVDYSGILMSSPFASNILRKIHGIPCLHCSTITCYANWTPAYTMNHVILEIRKYKKYKAHVMYKIFADKIKHKYLIDDIDLESWLF